MTGGQTAQWTVKRATYPCDFIFLFIKIKEEVVL